MKKHIVLLAVLGSALQVSAQDMLIFKDKTVEEVRVLEITTDGIKYQEYNAPENAVIFSVEKDYINKVVFEGGRVMDFSKSLMEDERVYADQKQTAFKIDGAGLSSTFTHISYEQMIDPSRSWEAGLVFIGAGFPTWEDEHPMGAGINLGYKFKRSPNFYMQKMRYSHIMRGAYIKPNIWLSLYNYDFVDYNHPPDPVTFQYPTTRKSAYSAAMMVDFGNQLIFADQVAVDYAFGIGYGINNREGWAMNQFGIYGGYNDWSGSPLAYSFTLKFGLLAHKKK